jgi:hypothetical protein
MTRKLTLHLDRLAELTTDELSVLAAGAPQVTVPCPYTLGLCLVPTVRCLATEIGC